MSPEYVGLRAKSLKTLFEIDQSLNFSERRERDHVEPLSILLGGADLK
jgi:hypothetical protein